MSILPELEAPWSSLPNVKFTCKLGVIQSILNGHKSFEYRLSTPQNDLKIEALKSKKVKLIYFFNAPGFFKHCPLVVCRKGKQPPVKISLSFGEFIRVPFFNGFMSFDGPCSVWCISLGAVVFSRYCK